jgi:hypothetical protein
LRKQLSIIVVVLSLSGCAVREASLPPVGQATQDRSKDDIYAAYSLTFHGGLLDRNWTRKDGTHTLGELNTVFDAYPDTRALKARARVRTTVIQTIGFAGLGLMLGTFFASLSPSGNPPVGESSQIVLYSAGGGMVVTAILLNLVLWHDFEADLADAYNRDLANDLWPFGRRSGKSESPPPGGAMQFTVAPFWLGGRDGAIAPGLATVVRF